MHVGNYQCLVTGFGTQSLLLKCRQIVLVVAPARNGLVKNGRIGGHASDAVLGDEARELTVVEQGAGKVVEPDLLAELAYLKERIHRCA